MEIELNEILMTVNEKFKLNKFELVGIDDKDILWSSKNDSYGISWDILNQNIRIYFDGYQIGFYNRKNIYNNFTEVNKEYYNDLLSNLVSNISEEVKNEIERGLKKYVVFERYEEAEQIKKFLDLFK